MPHASARKRTATTACIHKHGRLYRSPGRYRRPSADDSKAWGSAENSIDPVTQAFLNLSCAKQVRTAKRDTVTSGFEDVRFSPSPQTPCPAMKKLCFCTFVHLHISLLLLVYICTLSNQEGSLCRKKRSELAATPKGANVLSSSLRPSLSPAKAHESSPTDG